MTRSAVLHEAARRVLGACEVTAVLGDAVVRVSDARGQEFVVKQHASRSKHDREVHAYRYWTAALAPSAPRLIAADSAAMTIVITMLRGQPCSGDPTAATHDQAGTLLRRFHDTEPARELPWYTSWLDDRVRHWTSQTRTLLSTKDATVVDSHLRGLFASLCPCCHCVIRWICDVTAGRRARPRLDSRVSERKRYPGDLTGERQSLTGPVITAWKAAHRSVSSHQGGYAMREIVNAILYQSRTGCQREYLPHDLPPRSAACYYFARWRDDGTDEAIHDLLRWHAREKRGRRADPTMVVLDTQSVHAAASVPADTTGRDAGKKVPGRKRCLAVDVLGLVVAVVVLAASAHENAAGIALLDQVTAHPGTVSTALAGQGFKNAVVAHGAAMGIDVQVVERNPAGRGFVPSPSAGWPGRPWASCPFTGGSSAITVTGAKPRQRGGLGLASPGVMRALSCRASRWRRGRRGG